MKPSILILNWTELKHGREIFRGIWEYAHSHTQWRFETVPLEKVRYRLPKAPERCDGAIAGICDPSQVPELRRRTQHIVNVSSHDWAAEFPTVRPNNEAIGRLAAEHLQVRGFRRFAFVGSESFAPGLGRAIGFFRTLMEQDDAELLVSRPLHAELPERFKAAVRPAELEPVPSGPIGIFAENCYRGRALIEHAAEQGRRVPGEVAVIGGDEDDFLCETCDPTLSAVDGNSRRIGYEAASLLDKLMKGRGVPARPVEIPPVHVVSRQSTEAVAVEDATVAWAMQYIRDHIGRSFTVNDLVAKMPLSRRALERRFHEALGRTPHQEIALARIERITQLLATTDWSIEQVARSSGFRYAAHMTAAFRKATGRTPTQYRRQLRGV